MNTFTPEQLICQWLAEEHSYSSEKFGSQQIGILIGSSLNDNMNFGGRIASYWARMDAFEEGDVALQRAQAAGKVASASRSLWATIRSADRLTDRHATQDSFEILHDHFADNDFHNIKPQLEKDDFGETYIGLGLTYLDLALKRQGLASKFRLGQLVRAEQIMVDAADVAAIQFERCLEATGNLPAPGVTSGEMHPWLQE